MTTVKKKPAAKKSSVSGRDARGRFTKGNSGGKKGTHHKFTNLKNAFFAVFEKIESEAKKKKKIDSFYEWAVRNPSNQGDFYKMLSKMLPTNVSFEGDVPVTFVVSDKYMPKKRKPKHEK